MNFTGMRWMFGMAAAGLMVAAASMGPAADAASAPESAETSLDHGRNASGKGSPVQTFRRLLAMSAEERNQFLTNYPPATRARILEKVQEYQILPPPFGEMRLQVTELRWYLLPLLSAPAANREARLSNVPEPYQTLVRARLEEWDLLPPPLKSDVLEYETLMHYFVGRGAVVQQQMGAADLPASERSALERKLRRWQQLPEGQRRQMYASFERYLRLNEEEQQRILDSLSAPERQETEKVLEPFENWPKAEQDKYMVAFHKFSNMSPEERQQFLRTAARWQRMSETERQAWRDLVKIVAETPPMPPGFVPPASPPSGAFVPVPFDTNPTSAPVR